MAEATQLVGQVLWRQRDGRQPTDRRWRGLPWRLNNHRAGAVSPDGAQQPDCVAAQHAVGAFDGGSRLTFWKQPFQPGVDDPGRIAAVCVEGHRHRQHRRADPKRVGSVIGVVEAKFARPDFTQGRHADAVEPNVEFSRHRLAHALEQRFPRRGAEGPETSDRSARWRAHAQDSRGRSDGSHSVQRVRPDRVRVRDGGRRSHVRDLFHHARPIRCACATSRCGRCLNTQTSLSISQMS